MIRLLLKKQMLEIFKSYFYDAKKNKRRSTVSTVAFFVLFALLMVGMLGGMFGGLAYLLCEPFYVAGFGWFYYAIMGIIGIALGTFGSVFNTFQGLYLSKDNDFLLSLPIPVKSILVARLLGVYLLGLMYSAVVTLPAAIVYWIMGEFTVSSVIGGLVMMLSVSIINLVLSCVLGWAVARLSLKLKHKSIATVLIALVGIVLYYFVFYKAQMLLNEVIANIAVYGPNVKEKALILYYIGEAGTGKVLPMMGFLLVTVLLAGITYFILERSFIKIATSTGATAKAKYVQKRTKSKGMFFAVLGKEFGRFLSSPNYILNCSLGTIFLPILGVFYLIKGDVVFELGMMLTGSRSGVLLLIGAMITMAAAMNDSAAPSVSLEGKSIWLTHVLPIPAKMFLNAKIMVQLLLTEIPMLFTVICISIGFKGTVAETLLFVALAIVGVAFFTMFDMFLGITFPNLSWTNEITPLKQSLCVFVALFGSWGYCILWPGLFFLIDMPFSAEVYLCIQLAVTIVLAFSFYAYIMKKGAKKFEQLSC